MWAGSDLLGSIGFTKEELADKLYDSLHNKLDAASGRNLVYPAHGAGLPACGKNPRPSCGRRWASSARPTTRCAHRTRPVSVALVTEEAAARPAISVYNRDPQPQGPRTAR